MSLPAGPLLLVSPHLDDAILSCAALIEREEPIDVLTIFAGAPDPPRRGWWDEECGFRDSTESVPARLAEDRAAFDGTPHRREYLPLLELQHFDGPRGRGDAQAIRAAVGAWLDSRAGATVALPAGAGCPPTRLTRVRRRLGRKCSPLQHPDHVFVRDALLTVEDCTLLLYEELPYLFGVRADREVRRVRRALGRRSDELSETVDPTRKAQRIAAYASQIPYISPDEGRLDDPNVLPARERYWLLVA